MFRCSSPLLVKSRPSSQHLNCVKNHSSLFTHLNSISRMSHNGKFENSKKKKHKRISLSPAAFDCFWVFLIALFVFYLRQKRSRKSFRCCRLLSADFLLLPTHIFLFDMLMSLNGHVFLKPFYCLVPAWLPRQKSCDRILLISPSFFLFQTLTYKYTYTSSDIAVWF